MTAVREVRLETLRLPLVEPFETSFGVERLREFLLVEVESKTGAIGRGECVAARVPGYSRETTASCRRVLSKELIPRVLSAGTIDPVRFHRTIGGGRTDPMAKAALEAALWDLSAREASRSLSRFLGGIRSRVEVGVSVGIQPTVRRLVRVVHRYVEAGYARVKLKVRPGWAEEPVRAVRKEFPDLRLWVDANQAFRPRDGSTIRQWSERERVEQVEQPFRAGAFGAHARLLEGAPFRVCLDESLVDLPSLRRARAASALSSVNVKPGRVGGLGAARAMGREAARMGLPAWVGGMLESGVGRAANVGLAARSEFVLPGDLSASGRYYAHDLIDAPFRLGPGSTLAVPTGPGLGVEIDERIRRRALVRRSVLRR